MSSVTSAIPERAPVATRTPVSHDLSDEDILARFAASDPVATRVFVERFQRRVFGLAFTILGEPRAAEDVAQEALLRAFRHADVFDRRRGSVATWLLAITRNLAIDATRVRRSIPVAPDDLVDLVVAEGGRDPADVAVVRGDIERLRDALSELSEPQRRAVVLAGVWGLTSREIAEREQVPLGTAKTRIRIGLSRLRIAFARDDASD